MKHPPLILILVLLIVGSISADAASNWPAYGKNPQHDFTISGFFYAQNFSLQNTAVANTAFTPIVYDLDGDGYKEVVVMSGGKLQVWDFGLTLIDEKIISDVDDAQLALTLTDNCNSILESAIAFYTNPLNGTPAITFQLWCFNGSNLYQAANSTLWGAGSYANDHNADAGVSCDSDSCVFRMCVNASPECVHICYTDVNPVVCTNISSYPVSDAKYDVWIPTLAEIDKSIAGNEIVMLSKNLSNGYYGINIFSKSGVLLAENDYILTGIASTYWTPHATIFERSGSLDNYIILHTPATVSNWNYIEGMGAYDKNAALVWSATATSIPACDGTYIFGCHQSFGSMIQYNSTAMCALSSSGYSHLGVGLFRVDAMNCYRSDGTVVKQLGLGTTGGYSSYPGNKAVAYDANNDGSPDYQMGGSIFDIKNGGVVSYAYVPSSAVGDKWLTPSDLNNDGRMDIIRNDLGQLSLYLSTVGAGYSTICTDTDSLTYPTINYVQKGTVSFGVFNYTDFCTSNQLTEFYCLNAYPQVNWTVVGCTGGCVDGACLGCVENWLCTGFGSCVSGMQTRVCTDGNACGTTYSRPALTQTCYETNITVHQANLPNELIDSSMLADPTHMQSGWLPELFFGILVFAQWVLIPAFIILLFVMILMAVLIVVKKVTG